MAETGTSAQLEEQDTETEAMKQSVLRMMNEGLSKEEAKELVARSIRKLTRPGLDAAPAIYDAGRFIDSVYDEYEAVRTRSNHAKHH